LRIFRQFGAQSVLLVPKGFAPFGSHGFDLLSNLVGKAFAHDLRFVCHLFEQALSLRFEFSPRDAEALALPSCLSLLRCGVAELSRDLLLSRVHRAKDWFVEETLEQPDQDEEVDGLGADSKPINQHSKRASTSSFKVCSIVTVVGRSVANVKTTVPVKLRSRFVGTHQHFEIFKACV
jgi:hypothetical protein